MKNLQRVWHAIRERLPSGHLVPPPPLGLGCAPVLGPDSPRLPCLYSTFTLNTPLFFLDFALSKLYDVSVSFVAPPPPHLKLCITFYA